MCKHALKINLGENIWSLNENRYLQNQKIDLI